jgi:hypothetical protein
MTKSDSLTGPVTAPESRVSAIVAAGSETEPRRLND